MADMKRRTDNRKTGTHHGGLLRRVMIVSGLLLAMTLPQHVRGHVDSRLRLGYRHDPMITALAHLTEIYVEEVSGYTIDLKEYEDSSALQKAITQEKVDVAIEYPAEAWAKACPERGAFMSNIFSLMKSYYRETYGAVWVGMFNMRKEDLICLAPSYVITRGVAEDLSYYTLPDYLKKLISAVTRQDMDEILRKSPDGDDRGVLHEYLVEKKLI